MLRVGEASIKDPYAGIGYSFLKTYATKIQNLSLTLQTLIRKSILRVYDSDWILVMARKK